MARRAPNSRSETIRHTPSTVRTRRPLARVGRLSIEGFAPVDAIGDAPIDALLERSTLLSERAGSLVYVNDQQAYFEGISEDLAAKGVIYLPIAEAIKQHSELMEKYFLQESTELGSEKFFGLHAAQVKAGSILFVPRGVEVSEPLVNYYWTSGDGAAVFPHTLIITEDNAKAMVVDVFFSETEENTGLNISVANIHAGNGANISAKSSKTGTRRPSPSSSTRPLLSATHE